LLAQADALLAARGREEARACYRAAAATSERAGDAETLARAALGLASRRSGTSVFDAETAGLLERARTRLAPEQRALAIRVASRLGAELLLRAPRETGEKLIDGAVRDARALGDPELLGWVLDDSSYALWSPSDPRGFIELNREIAQLALQQGDAELRFRATRSLAIGFLETGNRGELVQAIHDCEAIDRDAPLPYTRTIVAAMRAMVALLDGRLSEARTHAETTAGLAGGTAELGFLTVALLLQVQIHRAEGTLAALAPTIRDMAQRPWGDFMGVRVLAAQIEVELGGAIEPARRVIDEFARTGVDAQPRDRNWLPTMTTAAELCVLIGAKDAAAVLTERLSPYAQLGAGVGAAGCFLGAIAHHLGALALVRGRKDEAIAQLEAGAAFHERLGAIGWLANTRALLARARAQRGLRLARRVDGAGG
jgi:hypothetical protein